MSALHKLRRLSSGRLGVAGPLAVLAAVPVIAPRPDGRIATTPSAIVRAPLGEDASCNTPYDAPFGAGERMEYSVKFGMDDGEDDRECPVRDVDDGVDERRH